MTTNPAPASRMQIRELNPLGERAGQPDQFVTPALGPLPPIAVTMLTRGPTFNRPAGTQFIRLVTQALAGRMR